MTFPSEIKLAMRDAILKLIWPKNDIIEFFKSNNCTSNDIKSLGSINEKNRAQLIDEMFQIQSSRNDGGLGQFRSMLQTLLTWQHFDPYYFDNLKKLNHFDAQNSINHLKLLQQTRDEKIKADNIKRKEVESSAKKSIKSLNELKDEFLSLLQNKIVGAKRGYAFEKLLYNLAIYFNLETTEPFKVNGEQIDGAIKFEGEHYLFEAKWQDKESSNESVYQFAGKVEGKFYGRGLFISINGFSTNVIKSFVIGKALKTIFIDGADIIMVLEGFLTFNEMLDQKIKAAQTRGEIYFDAFTKKSKL